MNETPKPPLMRLAYWLYLPMIALGFLARPPGGFGISHPTRLLMGMGLALVLGAAVATKVIALALRLTGLGLPSLRRQLALGKTNR